MGKVIGVAIIVLLVAAILSVGGALAVLLVWAMSGLGWILINWLRLPFSPFEATLLSFIGLAVAAWIAGRLLSDWISLPSASSSSDSDEDYDEDEWDEDEDEYEDEEPEQVQHIPSIPKWRQPIRRVGSDVPVVAPDDRCPCGSGRKYKNCHGRKT